VPTIFAVPKPFAGEAEPPPAQHTSQLGLPSAAVEILLLGDEYGVAEMAAEVGASHVPGARSCGGTARLDSPR
jgi:hypothetical protein